MLPVAPKRWSAARSARGRSASRSVSGSASTWRACSRTSCGRMRMPSPRTTRSRSRRLRSRRRQHRLLAEDGQRPEHQDELRLLLVVAQDHPHRAVLDVAGVDLHARLLGRQHGLAARPDHGDVERVHEHRRGEQEPGLEGEGTARPRAERPSDVHRQGDDAVGLQLLVGHELLEGIVRPARRAPVAARAAARSGSGGACGRACEDPLPAASRSSDEEEQQRALHVPSFYSA